MRLSCASQNSPGDFHVPFSICGTCTEDPLSLAGFLAKMACGLLTVPIYRHFRSPASLPAQMACGLLVVPIPRHYNRSTFARRLPCSHGLRLLHGTHPPTIQPIHFRSPASLQKWPAACSRYPSTDTFARRLPCSNGLRLAHGTHPPTLKQIHFRSPVSLLTWHAACSRYPSPRNVQRLELRPETLRLLG